MKVLLLGASGLLGHNLLKTLLQRNISVVALLRHGSPLEIADANLTLIRCKTFDEESLAAAAIGCDAIINSAGITDMSLRYEEYLPINSRLPELLVGVMLRCNVGTLVHVSTANTVGFGSPHLQADESAPMQPPFSNSYYAMSKKIGEDYLLSAAREYPHLRIVVTNPGFMIGPYDIKPSSGAMLLAGYRRRFMMAPKGGKSFVHVSAVATAVVNAMETGCSGEKYLLTASNMTIKDLYEMQARICSYKQTILLIPNWLMSFAGCLGDLLRKLGLKISLSTRNVRQLMVTEHYSNAKASEYLKMPDITIENAIRDFHQYRNTKNAHTPNTKKPRQVSPV